MFFDINPFIGDYITDRKESFFAKDIAENKDELSSLILNKRVLVIGGAGTIGSSFIKAILPFRPSSLTVVDYNENGLTELTRDLRSDFNEFMPSDYITYPFDFGSSIFAKLYNSYRWDIVACFAAHKHVRSEKDHLAIEAMVRNNVFNTKNLLELAVANPPSHLFSVSTDKAANPVNVMGASKKLMEKILLSYSDRLKICTARFANVAFSNGSLLDGFIHRIMKHQPLSAPNDIRRYFVSPIESGQLCMLACLLGKSKDIFFPKLHESQMTTFSTIAEKFLLELDLKPDYCLTDDEARSKAKQWKEGSKSYPVRFFETKTSGEKPFEEFYSESDELDLTRFHALGIVANSKIPSTSEIDSIIEGFERLFSDNSLTKEKIVNLIGELLSDFNHIETKKSLDQRI